MSVFSLTPYLNEYSLNESKSDEYDEPSYKMQGDSDEALGVQAEKHHVFTAKVVCGQQMDLGNGFNTLLSSSCL